MPRSPTYWHLKSAAKKPGPYEIVSSALLYYPSRGLQVSSPLANWHLERQRESGLQFPPGEEFSDPRQTTYARYVERQKVKEIFVDQLLEGLDNPEYEKGFHPAWLDQLNATLGVLRFPFHALQMLACEVGHLAPSGRLVITFAFQAADEMRRVQRIAYRCRQLATRHSGFAETTRERWHTEPVWQPLRRMFEHLLTTRGWGEQLIALNLAVKPMLDSFFMVHVGRLAESKGDRGLQQLFSSLYEDCVWHNEVTFALCAMLNSQPNRAAIEGWYNHWRPQVHEALEPLSGLFKLDWPLPELEALERAALEQAGLSQEIR